MVKLGITGGIGSGKSVVSRLLSVWNIPVYDTDSRSKEILSEDEGVKSSLSELLGDEIYAGGVLDRALMASKIFNDKELLERANGIIHPAVIRDFERWCSAQKSSIVGCESAILLQGDLKGKLDYVLTVSCPEDVRIDRACSRDNSDRDAVQARVRNQMSDEERERLADFTVVNDGNSSLIMQVKLIIVSLLEMA